MLLKYFIFSSGSSLSAAAATLFHQTSSGDANLADDMITININHKIKI